MAPTTLGSLEPVLYMLSVLGTYHTWGRTVLDGSLSHLLTALHGSKPYILPGTESPLRTRITGIYWPVDYLLDVLIVFFWEAVDGSHPATSAVGIYFLAQYFSLLTGVYVDSLRLGQSGKTTPTRTMLWVLLFQLSAIACTGPFWALWYLANSPLITNDISFEDLRNKSRAPARQIILILPSLVLGYLLPAVAMALPSPGLVSNDFQQLALVAWNIFPVLVYLTMQVLHALLPAGTVHNQDATRRSAIRILNATSLLISSAVHVGLMGISFTTILFPNLWTPETIHEFHPVSLLIPPVSVTATQTVGDGVHSFFLWDQVFGYTLGILVAWLQLRTVLIARGWYRQWPWPKVLLGVVGGAMIAGPGSVCLGLNWIREELLMPSAEGSQKEE
ncbi:uncharacterized protein P174DRAFT_412656 [Aspergillus novofumigatus IBT 16806]|uniref:Uncharacterized protein n=1 Tax=Aspergillus novofumigatus (strain IBT 16806) TaxID=1392255 RepID=A0A2I1BX57_ASPN1|nr:uncharacterized protein P174DRAFT_412656 [Aspergillus novofumigatus IBT 16806]PKX89960.1 hypothetical protein P174DRAFT_412656 [Aspergillus novofumigatus IBT 16806]